VPQGLRSRPGAEGDLGDELRLDPDDTTLAAGFAGEGRGFRRDDVELLLQRSCRVAGEAGADAAGRLQLAILVIAQHQRAELIARSPRRDVAGDDEFLALRAFRLDPVAATAAAIGCVGALGDHTLQPHAAGVAQHGLARLDEMLGIAQGRICSCGLKQPFQPFLAGEQRL
jgi:hypothetical protein